MKTYTTKLKIQAVSQVQTQLTAKTTTRKVILTVSEIPASNPFGNRHDDGPQFEVEVYNHNIESFNVTPALAGETGDFELEIKHYRKNDGPSLPKFFVNDLTFRI